MPIAVHYFGGATSDNQENAEGDQYFENVRIAVEQWATTRMLGILFWNAVCPGACEPHAAVFCLGCAYSAVICREVLD